MTVDSSLGRRLKPGVMMVIWDQFKISSPLKLHASLLINYFKRKKQVFQTAVHYAIISAHCRLTPDSLVDSYFPTLLSVSNRFKLGGREDPPPSGLYDPAAAREIILSRYDC